MQEANFTNQTDAPITPGRGRNLPLLQNRRRGRRLALNSLIEVRGESPFNPKTLKGRTRDIAANGVYFLCHEAYLAGQVVHVTIGLSDTLVAGSDSLALTLRCRVQRVEEFIGQGSKTFGVAVALDE